MFKVKKNVHLLHLLKVTGVRLTGEEEMTNFQSQIFNSGVDSF